MDDAEVARMHQFTAVVQRMQTAHLANPRQTRNRVFVWQMLAGVHHLVAHIPQQHATGEQRGKVAVDRRQQPPDAQQRQAVEHDQPGGKEDHPPVARRLVAHLAFDEKAMVIAGVALIEQLAEARLVVPQALVHLVFAPAEEHQAQRHQQPLPERHRVQRAPQQAYTSQAVGQDKAGMQPGGVQRVDGIPITCAESLGIVVVIGHGMTPVRIDSSLGAARSFR